ncbi:hypothetical protein A2715_00815 [Candidatus Woesebacteria bacterium RIFCSPHIGHO2_01_FULL_39_32]|uniref:Uncharacterized protein n=1 Tax=Candidatus Woesebacteria bacterium RIFCSPLOWO2_01_FULL_39_25 TaxID=1802521 RepID=A0A1F8BI78_9BACT|nr:MAG: hypothetical protein A2124_03615 [Candidatus Woesebacteria bacterium GWB1_37_5]OGM24455.1 MAG: hypothetical protein A2715_00815 [Candidatus Woesebacteria bacterium RIFCSPHIGHO2_01_FULL_39_32]OGM36991.1 MAG: hypothetical protein A3F01_05120 [Candidatus Woesebacteria bacterium RIFCSPHIGHO2_12_FULL_38_11]OGM63761.1 MAG: hypothetical protein A2893_02150 [Candidatus Woesebacteria bacterium RIFCSPLOWO2_01_FULL_39_25]
MTRTEVVTERRINQGIVLDPASGTLAANLWGLAHPNEQPTTGNEESILFVDKISVDGWSGNSNIIGTVVVKAGGSLEQQTARLGIFFRRKPDGLDLKNFDVWLGKVGTQDEKPATVTVTQYANSGFRQSWPASMAAFFPDSSPISRVAQIKMPSLILQQTLNGWITELQQDIPAEGVPICLNEAIQTLTSTQIDVASNLPLAA